MMLPRRYLVVLTAVLVVGSSGAQAGPPGGETLYRRHCAPCHGLRGHGDGPAAGALCPGPPDLTRLSAGMADLMRKIDGRRTIRAHGSAAMPVWGEVFEQSLIGEPHQRRVALLHVQALADYVHRLREHRDDPRE